jgi:hypothetical protein
LSFGIEGSRIAGSAQGENPLAWVPPCSIARMAAGTTSSRHSRPVSLTPTGTLQIVNVTTALEGILTDAFRREAGYQ